MDPKIAWGLSVLIAATLVANVVVLSTRTDTNDPVASGSSTPRTTATPTATSPASSGTPGPTPTATRTRTAARPFVIPGPGRYVHTTTRHYESTSSLSPPVTQDEKGRTTYTYRRARRSRGVWAQSVVVQVAGEAGSKTRALEWRPTGLFRMSERTPAETCTYAPPIRLVRFPTEIGDTWSVENRRCRERERGGGVSIVERVRVLERATVVVDGTSVDCFVLESATETTVTDEDVQATSTSTDLLWFAPRYGLIVRTESTSHSEQTGTYQGQAISVVSDSTTTSVLRSLEPG